MERPRPGDKADRCVSKICHWLWWLERQTHSFISTNPHLIQDFPAIKSGERTLSTQNCTSNHSSSCPAHTHVRVHTHTRACACTHALLYFSAGPFLLSAAAWLGRWMGWGNWRAPWRSGTRQTPRTVSNIWGLFTNTSLQRFPVCPFSRWAVSESIWVAVRILAWWRVSKQIQAVSFGGTSDWMLLFLLTQHQDLWGENSMKKTEKAGHLGEEAWRCGEGPGCQGTPLGTLWPVLSPLR